jgi:predicted ArsR family transcriptional regulator
MPDSPQTAATYRDLAKQCARQAATTREEKQVFEVAERNWRKLEQQARKREGEKPERD